MHYPTFIPFSHFFPDGEEIVQQLALRWLALALIAAITPPEEKWGDTMEIAKLIEANPEHWQEAAAIRTLTLDAVAAANSGHSGMPMGMADVATVLWSKHLRYDASAPNWPDRDRFVLSAGHGSMLLYSLLYLSGFEDMSLDQIKNFRQWGAITAGHPEYGHAAGIETTTGPLGQGLAMAVGMAIAEAQLKTRFGKAIVDHHTWVIAGDGCLMEGVSQEAISLAGHLKLGKLIVLWDDNDITIDGAVSLADSTDQKTRFIASGWHVLEVDGHDPVEIDRAMKAAKADPRPSMIACKTRIALGSSAENTSKGHGALTDPDLIKETKAIYGWEAAPFEIPSKIKASWEAYGKRGVKQREEWEERLAQLSEARRAEFERVMQGELPKRLSSRLRGLRRQLCESQPKLATRKASEMVLDVINPIMRETMGGSADLTGSNNTLTSDLGIFSADNAKGRYLHYGIREHGMAAAMNGMALHGGIRPYGGTFMAFTDYARPAMRLSALMGVAPVYVMTHDSIGLGEDGPTHQPVEHVASLRAMPNMLVFRPADAVETSEAWELAFGQTKRPSVLALSRQSLPAVRLKHTSRNLSEKGGYVLADAEGGRRQAIILASGSEVSIALEARNLLQNEGVPTRVVSMPCHELFAEMDEAWRKKVLPAGAVRVAVEAGVEQGWERWLIGERGREAKAGFVGMNGFGASAPAEELYKRFGITAEAVAEKVKSLL